MEVSIPPDIPPEVMTKVLSNLGRNDLLNCRLVCRSWNKECLIYLKKSKYTLHLNLARIKSYVKFTNEKNNQKLILPFYIELSLGELPLWGDNYEFYPPDEMDKFNKNLKILIRRFGSECIVSLSLSLITLDDNMYVNKMLIFLAELFHLVSSGLKILDLKDLFIGSIGLVAMEHFITRIKQRSINFPNLKKMKINIETGQNHRLEIRIVQFILENSHNLGTLNLKCKNASIFSAIPVPFEKLKTLKLGWMNNPSVLLRNIQECQALPVLQTLKIALSDIESENKIYLDILDFFSRTIKTLTIKFCGFKPALTFNFPKFPKLKYLKIKIKWYTAYKMPFFLNLCDIKFNPDTFPVLNYLEVPVGCFFLPEVSLEQLSLNISSTASLIIPVFTNITKLTINVYESMFTSYPTSYAVKLMCELFQKYVEHLQTVFSYVTSVVIVDKSKQDRLEKYHMKQLIKELIQSDLASNIQNITLKNCDHDFLGQALKQLSYQPQHLIQNQTSSSDISSIKSNVLDDEHVKKQIITIDDKNKLIDHKMTDIRTIQYEQCRPMYLKKQIRKPEHVMVNELELNLLVKHFPNLSQIGISSLKFDQGDKQKCSKQIQNLRIQFPNITFNMI